MSSYEDRKPVNDAPEQLAELLAQHHEKLICAGNPGSVSAMDSEQQLSETDRIRLQRARACLVALEQLRRNTAQDKHPVSSGSLEFPGSSAGFGGSTTQNSDHADVFHGLPMDREDDTAGNWAGHPWPNAAMESEFPMSWGRFQVLGELGRGGQGIVFLAHDPHLNREVALKIPRPEVVMTPELRERFLREAQTAARLDHPHLVTVYEAGEIGPVCYMTTAYCPGTNLSTWIRQQSKPIPPPLAGRLVATLAEAVQYIHRRGIVHRDLKPANVVLQNDPAGREPSSSVDSVFQAERDRTEGADLPLSPRLMDFGLAKLEEVGQGTTRTGAVLGTPQYMAPELADGRLSGAGPHTDIYGLGAILYELLTGRPPYARGATELETLHRVMRETPATPRSIRPEIPGDLEAICQKAMNWDPAMRYRTAADLADDLHRFLEERPIVARPPGAWGRLRRWSRRNPVVAALSVSLSCLVLVGLITVTSLWQRAAGHLETAEENQRTALVNFQQAHHAVRDFQNSLYLDDRYDAPEFQPMRRQLLEITLKYYQTFLGQTVDASLLRADIADAHYQLAFVQANLGAKQEAFRLYRDSLPLWRQLAVEEPSSNDHQYFLAKTLGNMALLAHGERDFQRSLRWYSEALEIWGQLSRKRPDEETYRLELASTLHNLGSLHAAQDDPDRALSLLEKAEAISDRLLTQSHSPVAIRHQLGLTSSKIGAVLKQSGRLPEAIERYHRARSLFAEAVRRGDRLPDSARLLANTLHRLGDVHLKQQNHPDALEAFHEAERRYNSLMLEHPSMAVTKEYLASNCRALASVYEKCLDEGKAQRWYLRALALYEELAALDPGSHRAHCKLASLHERLGRIHMQVGRYDEARRSLECATEVCGAMRFHGDALRNCGKKIVNSYRRLAKRQRRESDCGGARESLERAWEVLDQVYGNASKGDAYSELVASLEKEQESLDQLEDVVCYQSQAR